MDTLARRLSGGMVTHARAVERAQPVVPLGAPARPVSRRRATGLRTPAGSWRWWETAAVCAVIALVAAAVAAMDPHDVSWDQVTNSTAVVANVFALLASVLLYVHWRLTGGGPLAWLVLGLSALSIHALALSGLVAADRAGVEDRPGMVLVTQVLLTVGVLLVVHLASRRLALDPLLLGIAVGVALFVARYAALVLTPTAGLSAEGLRWLRLAGLLLELTIAVGVATFPKAPRWVRYRLAAALAVLGVAHAAAYPVPGSDRLAGVATACEVVGSTILVALAIALVRLSVRDNRSAVTLLRDQLARAEAVTRADQAQLHEIRATIAGISKASHVVNTYEAVAPIRRARIREMIDAELSRLERLVLPSTDEDLADVDLDSTVEPIVVRMLAQDRPVHWTPGGHVARGRPDDVAEIVNILLTNAVRHAGGALTVLSTRSLGDTVEIAVSDAGPGVPPELREYIFEWGHSGPRSTGDGIGLHVARKLSTDMGGSLDLVESESTGATFVLTLPAVE